MSTSDVLIKKKLQIRYPIKKILTSKQQIGSPITLFKQEALGRYEMKYENNHICQIMAALWSSFFSTYL